jgi:hypothetical protein
LQRLAARAKVRRGLLGYEVQGAAAALNSLGRDLGVQTTRPGRAGDGLRGGGAPVSGSGTTGEGDDRWVPLVSHSGRRRGKRLAELGRAGWLAGPQA